jgi:hypothetical protein
MGLDRKMRRLFNGICFLLCFVPLTGRADTRAAPSPVFYQTRNSDEWVRHSIHVQQTYSRVLVVDATVHPLQQIKVSALSLNARQTDRLTAVRTYNVQAVFKTLQEAADAARGGDLIAVMLAPMLGLSSKTSRAPATIDTFTSRRWVSREMSSSIRRRPIPIG